MARRRRLIDFCCKAGGTSMGYHMAGFEVVGIDSEMQPNYPFRFMQDDITKITDAEANRIRDNFDAVAASPPCKPYSVTKTLARRDHPKLVEVTRELLEYIDLPYVIENVPGAPLIKPVQVCGSAFGLRVQRHRLFESNCEIEGSKCFHEWQDRDLRYIQVPNGPSSERRTGIAYVYGRGDGTFFRGQSQHQIWSHAMGIDWMTTDELAQAIPPLYTLYIGTQLMEYT